MSDYEEGLGEGREWAGKHTVEELRAVVDDFVAHSGNDYERGYCAAIREAIDQGIVWEDATQPKPQIVELTAVIDGFHAKITPSIGFVTVQAQLPDGLAITAYEWVPSSETADRTDACKATALDIVSRLKAAGATGRDA
ncbi:MAG: hypothetical protein KGL39_04085 [Patescibacteria group bacterium]|nr:hypothetical protein [Patescibacteria group bacterium]